MQAGDVVEVDFGPPIGSEAGFRRPAVVVSADAYLTPGAITVTVVPVTGEPAGRYASDVSLSELGLDVSGVAQCRLVTTVSTRSVIEQSVDNVGAVALAQIRSVIADLLDIE